MYGFFVGVYFYASHYSSTCIWVGLKLVPSFVIHSREVIWLAKGWPFDQHLHVFPASFAVRVGAGSVECIGVLARGGEVF